MRALAHHGWVVGELPGATRRHVAALDDFDALVSLAPATGTVSLVVTTVRLPVGRDRARRLVRRGPVAGAAGAAGEGER